MGVSVKRVVSAKVEVGVGARARAVVRWLVRRVGAGVRARVEVRVGVRLAAQDPRVGRGEAFQP